MKAVTSTLMGLVAIFGVSKANAWGAKGHQIVSFVGSSVEGEPFWSANSENMRTLSTVPDRVWKGSQTKAAEGPTHFFQADFYVKDMNQCNDILKFPPRYADAVSEYGESVLVENGTAPYRVVQMYRAAVDAFLKGDTEYGVEVVGAMSHYIGDLSQPLHVSENYDGKNTGNGGIHAWFETTNLGDEMSIRDEVMTRAQALMKDPTFIQETSGSLSDVINHEIVRSLEKRDEVLQNDTKLGRQSAKAKQAQLDLAEDRMADGAAVLAVVMKRLSQEAHLPARSSAAQIQDPQWIAPEYGFTMNMMMTPMRADKFDDDCAAL